MHKAVVRIVFDGCEQVVFIVLPIDVILKVYVYVRHASRWNFFIIPYDQVFRLISWLKIAEQIIQTQVKTGIYVLTKK